LYFRTIFEQQGFSMFALERQHTLIFIMLNERSPTTWKKRMKIGIHKLIESEVRMGKKKTKPIIGIGKFIEQLTNIPISYQTSVETFRISDRLSKESTVYFYDDLHIFRLISQLNRHLDLHEMVLEYLEPVIHYDKKHNGKLLETLKTYLACNASKQETANRLYIVRQTLYHRLEKLEKLLGHDFMDHEKRLAIEFMILSYEFLVSSKVITEHDAEIQ
jgi:purine catabolism regulator